MGANELSTLDRGTLRAWRITNLVGWGVAGSGACLLVLIAIVMLGRVLPEFDPAPWIAVPVSLIELAIAPAAAGLVVGAHVYRSPGLIAAIAVVLIGMLFVASISVAGDAAVLLIGSAVVALEAGFAWVVAGWRWHKRPRALRQTSNIEPSPV